ncbi:MAG TPA: hypothetical protein VFQ42_19175 [Mycobacterium sp.]|nr:hypothetical protein [Mycobacterium sp.]
MSINIERLRAEIQFCSDNPDLYEPGVYAAKTGDHVIADLSGWTCIHAGLVPIYKPRLATHVTTQVEGVVWIWVAALELLGLPMPEGGRLLAAGMTVPDLWRVASELTAGAIEVPADMAAPPAATPKVARKVKVTLQ